MRPIHVIVLVVVGIVAIVVVVMVTGYGRVLYKYSKTPLDPLPSWATVSAVEDKYTPQISRLRQLAGGRTGGQLPAIPSCPADSGLFSDRIILEARISGDYGRMCFVGKKSLGWITFIAPSPPRDPAEAPYLTRCSYSLRDYGSYAWTIDYHEFVDTQDGHRLKFTLVLDEEGLRNALTQDDSLAQD